MRDNNGPMFPFWRYGSQHFLLSPTPRYQNFHLRCPLPPQTCPSKSLCRRTYWLKCLRIRVSTNNATMWYVAKHGVLLTISRTQDILCGLQFYYFSFWPQHKQHVPVISAVAMKAPQKNWKIKKDGKRKKWRKKLTEEILPLDIGYYKQIYIID